MEKIRRARYTLEFKLEALRLIGAGQSIAAVAATLGLADQTLHNWVKAQREGRLGGPGSKAVSAEQMELARLRAELAKTKMELAIIKKRQRTSRGNRCEVRVDRSQPRTLAGLGSMRTLGRQREWLSPACGARCVPRRRPTQAQGHQQRCAVGTYQGHSRPGQTRVRLASDVEGTAGSRLSCW